MDVLRWQIAVVSNSGNSNNQPGLAMTVELKCRVCSGVVRAAYARTIDPSSVSKGHPYSEKNWFEFSVNSRLALQRNCEECGYSSIIPPKQAQALLTQTDSSFDLDKLRAAVRAMTFSIETLPGTDDYYPRDVYRGGRRKQIILHDWQPFDFSPAIA